MSKIIEAVMNGEANEFEAVVKGEVVNVVELSGRFYVRSVRAGRYFPIKKTEFKVVTPAVVGLH